MSLCPFSYLIYLLIKLYQIINYLSFQVVTTL
nr:MAG TPA: hypothetical protein [Caudoviricetes sp.]